MSLILGALALLLSAPTESGWTVQVFAEPPPLNRMHTWRIRILDESGAPVPEAAVTVTGGMPDHDHGLPTLPQVVAEETIAEKNDGFYRLDGLRFHMPGRWEIRLRIEAEGRVETARLELVL